MGMIHIFIKTTAGQGANIPVELPDDVPMRRLLPALVTRMSIPITNQQGEPIIYALDMPRTGKRLREDDTFTGVSAKSGEHFTLAVVPPSGSDIRLRRLLSDYKKILELTESSDIISIARTEGDPPELYVIRFRCRGVKAVDAAGKPEYSDLHEVAIYLEADYPRKKPQLKWLTPIFHPNIHENGAVCIGDAKDNYGWWPGRPLEDLIFYLGEMAQYEIYNPASAYNGEAAAWSRSHSQLLPTDKRQLRGPKIVINLLDSIQIGPSAGNRPEDDLLNLIKL